MSDADVRSTPAFPVPDHATAVGDDQIASSGNLVKHGVATNPKRRHRACYRQRHAAHFPAPAFEELMYQSRSADFLHNSRLAEADQQKARSLDLTGFHGIHAECTTPRSNVMKYDAVHRDSTCAR